MVILSHIAFVCFAVLFTNVVEKVWTKKMHAIGKENVRQILVGNLHNANLPINLSAKESRRVGGGVRGVRTNPL